MRKNVINTSKMEEGEFHPSKDVPDYLEDGRIMTVYWTVQGGDVYTFVSIEDAHQKPILEELDEEYTKPRNFYLYGALHDKVYPWQIELADLSPKLQMVVKSRSLAEAQVKMFDKAQSICDAILAAKKPSATMAQKMLGWKSVAHIENLFVPEKLRSSWFYSRHAATIEKFMDGLLTDEELEEIKYDFSKLRKSRKFGWKKRSTKKASSQLVSLFDSGLATS